MRRHAKLADEYCKRNEGCGMRDEIRCRLAATNLFYGAFGEYVEIGKREWEREKRHAQLSATFVLIAADG